MISSERRGSRAVKDLSTSKKKEERALGGHLIDFQFLAEMNKFVKTEQTLLVNPLVASRFSRWRSPQLAELLMS
jgi:hypothetical protein